MAEFVTAVADVARAILPLAISLGMVGVVIGLAMAVIGYRRGSEKA